MKRKAIEKIPPIMPKLPKRGKKAEKETKYILTAQLWEKYLILDFFGGLKAGAAAGEWQMRHVMQTETGEYETFRPNENQWHEEKLLVAEYGTEALWYWHIDTEKCTIDTASERLIREAAPTPEYTNYGYLDGMLRMEDDYSAFKRERKRLSKERSIADLMSKVPNISCVAYDRIASLLVGSLHYAFVRKDGSGHCTACNQDFECSARKIKHKQKIPCPVCGQEVVVIKRGDFVSATEYMTMIQDVDEKRGVERLFAVTINWEKTRTVKMDETVRRFMLREDKKYAYKEYSFNSWDRRWHEDKKTYKEWHPSRLYPDKGMIQAGLKGTDYESWSQVMPQLAAAGLKLYYDRLMVEVDKQFVGMTEYLLKGRFYRLLREVSESVSYYFGYRTEELVNMRGSTIEGVLGLQDRQRINRLRDKDGGKCMLQWLQWSEYSGRKISDAVLDFYDKTGIMAEDYMKSPVSKLMTPEKLMNYLIRQKKESYPGYKCSTILDQYEDYLEMCRKLGKHMDDEMVYRPRELKRRHEEAVEECNARAEELRRQADKEEAERRAQKMREKYPGYEELLQEIKAKYEYSNEKYMIIVPENFALITEEGMNLHHCVGSTERYFDRIVSRETYICFLRKCAEPEKSYYTIEVEPGGTIRQHRGMYDEEPEIEEVKPFLREWQKVIRKRMNAKDHEYAKTSEVLRQKNIDELKAKNNTRVLDGLMEDLMEVI